MATRKFRKSRSRKTTRRRKISTAGKILPPLDVRSNKHLGEFIKRIKTGPLTIIMVYADWCGHCHTMKPHFDAASNSSKRSIQSIKVNDTMMDAVNKHITRNVNNNAKPLNVEGYPSIIVVDKKGNTVTDIEPVRSTVTMTNLMTQAGPLFRNAGINNANENPHTVVNSVLKNSIKNIITNTNNHNVANNVATHKAINGNKNKLLENIGVENEGLVNRTSNNTNSFKNSDTGEDKLMGSIASVNNNSNKSNNSIKLNSITLNNGNKSVNNGNKKNKSVKDDLEESTAPSQINMFSTPKNKPSSIPDINSNINKEANVITSLAAPLGISELSAVPSGSINPLNPPNVNSDMDESESISNNLTAEQKVGGSLYSAMARTTYTLAPAAILLATSAMVMKGKKRKTHKRR